MGYWYALGSIHIERKRKFSSKCETFFLIFASVELVNLLLFGDFVIDVQGGHILAKMKFPVFSLSFPCVTKIFPVLFLCKN